MKKQGKLSAGVRSTLKTHRDGLEFYLKKLGSYRFKFEKAGTFVDLKNTISSIVSQINKVLLDNKADWSSVWTNKLTNAQKKRLEKTVLVLTDAPGWFGGRSIISPKEADDAAMSLDSILELTDHFQETLTNKEGWCL